MKKIVQNVIVNQLLILVLVLIFYRELTTLEYINVSFYLGGAYLFIGIRFNITVGIFRFLFNKCEKGVFP